MPNSLIFDRTDYDIKTAKEIQEQVLKIFQTPTQAQYEILERGCFTLSTLNRIETITQQLKTNVQTAGYLNNKDISTKSWLKTDVFYDTDLLRILNNVSILKSSYYYYVDTPDVPEPVLYYQNLNNIEKILYDIYSVYNTMIANYKECGNDIECGED